MRLAPLEAVIAGFKEIGARSVVLADPRLPVEVRDTELPAIVLTPIGASVFMGLPGNPHEIETVPNPEYGVTEPWPENARLWYRYDWLWTFQADVYGRPNRPFTAEDSAANLAGKAISWLAGAGRDALRVVKGWVHSFTAPQRRVELLSEVEHPAYEHWMFEFVLVCPQASGVDVPTVEEVHVRGDFEGAVSPQREFVVKTTE